MRSSKDNSGDDSSHSATPRPLYIIAQEIRKTWPNMNYAAKPYHAAMTYLTNITDQYGNDDAKSIVLYFLSNANMWRGSDARRIKAELRSMVK